MLYGGILEGALTDVLERDSPRALTLLGQRLGRTRTIRDADLAALVEVAQTTRVLSGLTARQCDVLRRSRNLVHPVLQARDDERVSEHDASMALNTVRKCLEELARRLVS